MTIGAGFAIYFIMWWVALFAVLPWGVRAQIDDGVIVPGSAPSAPVHPRLLRTVMATTIVATIVFALFYLNLEFGFIRLSDIPFLPTFDKGAIL